MADSGESDAGLGVWEWMEAEARPDRSEVILSGFMAAAERPASPVPIVRGGGGGNDRLVGTAAADTTSSRAGAGAERTG